MKQFVNTSKARVRRVNTAYKFRIYPNEEQKIMIAKTIGCCRFVYNHMLADKIAQYEKDGSMLHNTPALYKKEYAFLKEVDSLALANVQLHLETAYKNFFSRKETGFPKFKSKHRGTRSYTTNCVNGNITLSEHELKLPKMKAVKIKVHRVIPSDYRLKSVTVSQEASGKYFASILFYFESQETEPVRTAEKVLGIDFAMHGFGVFSDGTRAAYPMYYRGSEEKLAREQRRLSHCKKGSRNYHKQKRRVGKVHEKIRNQRKDFQHKLSHKLAEEMDAVCVEDLNLKGMSRGLYFGKSVMDNGYGTFLDMLEYKLKARGKQLVKVDRFYPSSKTCSCCGRIKIDLALSDRTYICECGNRMDRDVNAAINIREEGKRILCA